MTAELAVTIFILYSTIGILALPSIVGEFSKNRFLDLVLKRGCWVIGIYLMMLNASIVATLAQSNSLPVTQELFRYLWLFGTVGYLFMGYTVLKTGVDALQLWNLKKWERERKVTEEEP